MKREVAEFVSKCLLCQLVKAPKQKPTRLLKPLSIPKWKWVNLSMDFIVDLSRIVKGHTVIWVVIYKFTKSTHFIPGKPTYSMNKWAQIYMKEVVRLHGVPISIVFNKDPRFTSSFLKSLQSSLGT